MVLNSVKNKLVLFSFASLIVTVSILSFVSNGMLNQNRMQVVDALSTKTTAVSSGLFEHAISKMEENVIFTTRDPRLFAGIISNDKELIQQRIFPTGNRLEATGVTTNLRLLGLNGEILYSRDKSESGKYALKLAQESVAKMQIVSGVESVNGAEPEVHLVFPLTQKGKPIAVIDMALKVSSALTTFRQISGSDWVLYNLKQQAVAFSEEALANNIQQHAITVDQYDMVRMSSGKKELNLVMQPIYDYQGDAVAYIATATDYTQTYKSSDNQFLLGLFSVVAWVVIVMLLTWYTISKSLTPLSNMRKVVSSIRDQGDFSVRIPVQGNDEIAESANSINQLIGLMQNALKESNRVMHAIAQGDFTQRVDGDYHGDLLELKDAINQSTRSVDYTMRELSDVVKALHRGDFSVRMSEKVKGDIRHEVDAAMASIHSVIEETNKVLAYMAEGDFDQRISVQAFGDLKLLADNVNGRIEQTANTLEEIARVIKLMADGDLSQKVRSGFKGRFGDLAMELNQTVFNIAKLISQTSVATNTLLQNVDQIYQGSQDLNERTQRQASALEQTTATIKQITKALSNTTDHARSANQQSLNSRTQADEGARIMRSTIESMTEIRSASHKIEEIITLIDSIAFQTNLLALNAAVEAARAGEHGRGFAVVAGEVRNLAGKSAEAARDIKGLIENAVSAVEQGTQRAENSDQALQSITDSIRKVNDIVAEISAASTEQMSSMEQINRAVADIDSVTQQNAALVEQTTAASESMRDSARELEQLIQHFKV